MDDAPAEPVPAAEPEPSPEGPPTSRLRLVALAALIVGLFAVAHLTGITDRVSSAEGLRASVDELRATVQSAGAWGYLLLIVIFSVGELVHVPGLVFVFGGVIAYGKLVGGLVTYVGAVVSVTFSFLVVRTVGGQALNAVKQPWIRKVLDGIESRPIRTVALLRIFVQMSPPVNYALALSGISLRDYVLGSLLGLLPVIVVAAVFFEQLMVRFL